MTRARRSKFFKLSYKKRTRVRRFPKPQFNLKARPLKRRWRHTRPRVKMVWRLFNLWAEVPKQARWANSLRACVSFRQLGRISRIRARVYSRRLARARRKLYAREFFLMRRRRVLGLKYGPPTVLKKFVLDYSKLRIFRYPFIRTAARSSEAAAPYKGRISFLAAGFFTSRPYTNRVIKFKTPISCIYAPFKRKRGSRYKQWRVSRRRSLRYSWKRRVLYMAKRKQLNPTVADAAAVRPGRRHLKRYLRKLWRLALRIKFERFFFLKLGRPVYVWFHSIWGLFFRKFRRWRMSTIRFLIRARTKRRRKRGITIWFSMVKLILRTVGILSTVSGSLFCFAHVLGYLMQRFRQHFQLFRIVRRFLVRARRKFRTIHFFRIMVVGKFGGAMRARKFLMKVGRRGKFLLLSRRLQYIMIHSHTQWGVFGVRIWAHIVRRPIAYRRRWYPNKVQFLQKRTIRKAWRKTKILFEQPGIKEILGRYARVKRLLLE